jgi:hypothetical protein
MKCCICSNPDATYGEQRPSGNDGALETWYLCEECRKESERQRADTNPEICQSYKIFLQFICGYRMQRAFSGNRASANMPKTKLAVIPADQGETDFLETPMHMGISLEPGTTESNAELGCGPDRSDEDPGSEGAPGCELDDGGALPAIYGEHRL